MRYALFTAACPAVIFITSAMTCVNVRAQSQAAAAEQPASSSETGVLLLQDGGVLEGQVRREGTWYIVTRGGGQMQVSAVRVIHTCRSMNEAYEYRRQQSSESNTEAHLTLADWCLRYNLLTEAGRELGQARELDASHPRLALLERRLAKAEEPPSTSKPAPAPAKIATSPAVKSPSPTSATSQTPSTVTSDVPDAALELFARKVQPILVNSCTTSGCHQPGGPQSFQLDRAVLRGENNRRSTIRNLEAALALIDLDQPDKSPLLTIPHQRHGGMAAPIFGPRLEPAYKNLAGWVALVVPPPADANTKIGGPATTAVAADANPASNPHEVPPQPDSQVAKSDAATDIRPAVQPAANVPTPITQSPTPIKQGAATQEAPTLKTPHQLKIGARLQTWQSRDPFDAEIFNRMQRARGNAPAETRPVQAPPAETAPATTEPPR
jgi:hypothetical protein